MPHLLQSALLTLGSFVVVLSIVVTVHELGHFNAARLCKIPIKSFSLGFGPQLLSLKDKHGTVWKISAIPMGGFVSWIDDTDPTSTRPGIEEGAEISAAEARRRGYFRAQPIAARAFVTAAGPLSNFIFSIVAFALIAMIVGRDVTDYDRLRDTIPARVGAVQDHSAASLAGLKTGDLIVGAGGHSTPTFAELQRTVAASPGVALPLQVRRGDQILSLTATPGRRPHDDGPRKAGEGLLGVGPNILRSELTIQHVSPIEALGVGVERTWKLITDTTDYIGKVFTGRASGDQIAGPLGIMSASGQVASASLQAPPDSPGGPLGMLALNLFMLAAMLSVAVGFVNILPIPVLDGGHLLFYAVEALRGGRPLPPKAQEWAFWTGVSVLVSLFLFATWNDITHHLPGMQ